MKKQEAEKREDLISRMANNAVHLQGTPPKNPSYFEVAEESHRREMNAIKNSANTGTLTRGDE